MVKNKVLPDSARPCCTPRLVTPSLSLFLSLSLTDLALSRLVSRVFSLSGWCLSSWGYPLDPAEAGPWHSLEKTLMLGKIEGRRRRGQQRMRWLDGVTDSMDMGLGKLSGVGDGQGGLACCSPWGHKESDTTERLNWTELNWMVD